MDLLVRRYGQATGAGSTECSQLRLGIPLILKVDYPGLPVHAGGGIEPRFLLNAKHADRSTDDYETVTWYVPIVLGTQFDLSVVSLSAELRFELQISNHFIGPTADDSRMHQLMLYLGGFF